MKKVALVVAALFVLIAVYTVQAATTAPTSRITVTATVKNINVEDGARTDVLFLWDRDTRATPIGYAIIACQADASDGISQCTASFKLPYGLITAAGPLHNFQQFTMAVTGGTRSQQALRNGHPGYTGAAGTLFVRRLGPGTQGLYFLLS